MPIRNVELSERSDCFIDEAVEAGRFHDASEAVGEALRLLEAREHEHEAKSKWLQAAAKEGFDDLDHGDFVTLKSRDEVEAYLQQIHDEVKAEVLSERLIA